MTPVKTNGKHCVSSLGPQASQLYERHLTLPKEHSRNHRRERHHSSSSYKPTYTTHHTLHTTHCTPHIHTEHSTLTTHTHIHSSTPQHYLTTTHLTPHTTHHIATYYDATNRTPDGTKRPAQPRSADEKQQCGSCRMSSGSIRLKSCGNSPAGSNAGARTHLNSSAFTPCERLGELERDSLSLHPLSGAVLQEKLHPILFPPPRLAPPPPPLYLTHLLFSPSCQQ